ncbi:MAG: zinc-binding dehydrogenase [Acidobacteriota bacterium]|nr:zinc-binding dehydrogenase [Acidobacteriota bacterium]
MNKAIALHKMRKVIDRVYDFADWHKAIEDLQKGEHFGKLVIRVQ